MDVYLLTEGDEYEIYSFHVYATVHAAQEAATKEHQACFAHKIYLKWEGNIDDRDCGIKAVAKPYIYTIYKMEVQS